MIKALAPGPPEPGDAINSKDRCAVVMRLPCVGSGGASHRPMWRTRRRPAEWRLASPPRGGSDSEHCAATTTAVRAAHPRRTGGAGIPANTSCTFHSRSSGPAARRPCGRRHSECARRSEEHTSELQSLAYLVCRLLLEKKKNKT